MESIKKGWNSLTSSVRNTVAPQQQDDDYFSQSWFDSLIGGEDESCCASFKLPFKVVCCVTYTRILTAQRMTIVGVLVLFGILSLLFSFAFIMLPLKFAKLFTVGNMCILIASLFLRNIVSQIKSLVSDPSKLIAFVIYVISQILVLVCAFKYHSTILTIPCIVIEIVALLWYILAYIPYGHTMITACCKGCVGCIRSD